MHSQGKRVQMGEILICYQIFLYQYYYGFVEYVRLKCSA